LKYQVLSKHFLYNILFNLHRALKEKYYYPHFIGEDTKINMQSELRDLVRALKIVSDRDRGLRIEGLMS
jgi:hypothetical protein